MYQALGVKAVSMLERVFQLLKLVLCVLSVLTVYSGRQLSVSWRGGDGGRR